MLRFGFCSKTVYVIFALLLVAGCGSTSKPKLHSIVGSDAPNDTTSTTSDNGSASTTSTTSDTGTTTGGASAKDVVPPDTSIVSGPTGLVNNSSASFTFTGKDDVKVAGFACRLNSASWASCASPKVYSNLTDAVYTFEVRAVDSSGNVDASPATRTWTVDTVPPGTSISSAPTALTNSNSASFTFSSVGGSSFACQLDGSAFATCTTPKSYSGLADGSHTFGVRAIDAAGNTDATPATSSWTVDTTPPIVTISDGPASVTDVTTATNAHFVFACNEVCTTTWCSLDGVTAATCSSPVDVTGLTISMHTFAITGVDLAGNATTSETSQTWTVSVWRSIPGGTFSMGDALDGESDAPVHSVTLTTFEMMSYDVTNGTYEDCVTAGKCTVPGDLTSYSRSSYYGNATYADYPVIYVAWSQATQYCAWAGGRLPTEAEWEYAARGGMSGQRFPWGNTIDCSKANYYADPSYTYDTNSSEGACSGIGTYGDTTQVGVYAANGYGLYDMAGNVWDWANDWYGFYSSSPVTDPQGPATGSDRVIRGGSFLSDAGSVRVANRHNSYPSSQDFTIGFRCVRDYPTETTISSALVASTVATQASFELSCNKAVCSYFCSLDNGGWQSCTSPVSYSSLSTGAHSLAVTAMSNSGVTDPTPATWNWDIDSKGNLWQSIPGGTFGMSNVSVHNVTLTTFAMMSYEVTNGTYADCVAASACTAPNSSASDYGYGSISGDHPYRPVNYVDWNQATAYCSWAGGRLPTEAEWEYAARGGLSGKRFPWGDTIDCSKASYYAYPATAGGSYTYDTNGTKGACIGTTSRVGSYAANGYGLYDMAGNVFDWVNDWYSSSYYSSSPVTDPPGPATGSSRVVRGGYFHGYASYARVADRNAFNPTVQYSGLGFRCAR